MQSIDLPWLRTTLSDNHIPAAVHQAFNARRLATEKQAAQLRLLYSPGQMPRELIARLDNRHALALTEEEADVLILQMQETGHTPGKPLAEASAPASAIPTLSGEFGASRPADFVPDPNLLATAEQRDRIMTLLRRAMRMERKDKTRHMLNLLNYNQVRAEEIINELAEWVAYCESGDPVAA